MAVSSLQAVRSGFNFRLMCQSPRQMLDRRNRLGLIASQQGFGDSLERGREIYRNIGTWQSDGALRGLRAGMAELGDCGSDVSDTDVPIWWQQVPEVLARD